MQEISFWDIILKYWTIILGGLTVIGVFVKMFYNQKQMGVKLIEMQQQLDDHDKADKIMDEKLSAMIDRNKIATEMASREIQNQLSDIKATLAVQTNNMNLIIGDKIK